jgi:hypothetical protein
MTRFPAPAAAGVAAHAVVPAAVNPTAGTAPSVSSARRRDSPVLPLSGIVLSRPPGPLFSGIAIIPLGLAQSLTADRYHAACQSDAQCVQVTTEGYYSYAVATAPRCRLWRVTTIRLGRQP